MIDKISKTIIKAIITMAYSDGDFEKHHDVLKSLAHDILCQIKSEDMITLDGVYSVCFADLKGQATREKGNTCVFRLYDVLLIPKLKIVMIRSIVSIRLVLTGSFMVSK